MKKLNKYLKLQKEIFDYFGYIEDWVVIPIDDRRNLLWKIIGDERSGSVQYAYTSKDLNNEEAGNYYEDEIYTQRFLPKWVYRGEEYTMICVDPHVDGNKFLAIYTNDKEIKSECLNESTI
jgi:hypothetical protein